MNTVIGMVRLMRPLNSLMMGLAVIVGAAITRLSAFSDIWPNLIYGFTTGYALTAASMTINDYYDLHIDSINEPRRPLPSGQVEPKQALVLACLLTVIGFATAYLTSMFCLATAIIAWVIFVSYTVVGKRSGLPGNFLVSICVATPFVYGSVAATNLVNLNILIFAAIAFFSNTGREITKGIVDVTGDRVGNMKTLAATYGEKRASVTAVASYLLAVAASPLPIALGLVSIWYVPFVTVTDIGLIVSSLMLLRNHSREGARKVKRAVLLWFAVGLSAFVAGTLG